MNKNEMKIPSWIRHYRMFAVLLLSLALAACNGDSHDDMGMTSQNDVAVPVELSASQEVPSNASSATATGTLTVNSESGTLSGSITASGMMVTMAHIHESKAGSNGSVVIPLEVDGNMISVPAGTMLTSAQVDSMLVGDYYVNLHSALYAGGEIRGQIAPSGVEVSVIALSGDNEVPPVMEAGSGTAYVTLNRSSSMLSINIATATDTAATAAHIHGGLAGENGDVLLPLVQDTSDASLFSVSSVVDQEVIDAIDADGAYLNVHTTANPTGEIRGQISAE